MCLCVYACVLAHVSVFVRVHVYVCARLCIRVRFCKCTCAYKRARFCVCTCAYTRAYVCVYARAFVCAHAHIRARLCVCIRARFCVCACACVCTCVCRHACVYLAAPQMLQWCAWRCAGVAFSKASVRICCCCCSLSVERAGASTVPAMMSELCFNTQCVASTCTVRSVPRKQSKPKRTAFLKGPDKKIPRVKNICLNQNYIAHRN